ncbi:MAG: hypothetical protein V1845_00600 [bacterium]
MEKFEDRQQEEKEEPKKIAEGAIGKYDDNWQDKLPLGIKKEEVDLFLGSDGLWHWHLKPEFIEGEEDKEDKEEREKYEEEKEKWSG